MSYHLDKSSACPRSQVQVEGSWVLFDSSRSKIIAGQTHKNTIRTILKSSCCGKMTIKTSFDFVIVCCTDKENNSPYIENQGGLALSLDDNTFYSASKSSSAEEYDDDMSVSSMETTNEWEVRHDETTIICEQARIQLKLEELLERVENSFLPSPNAQRSSEDDEDSLDLARNRGVRRLQDQNPRQLLNCDIQPSSQTFDDQEAEDGMSQYSDENVFDFLVPLAPLSPANTSIRKKRTKFPRSQSC